MTRATLRTAAILLAMFLLVPPGTTGPLSAQDKSGITPLRDMIDDWKEDPSSDVNSLIPGASKEERDQKMKTSLAGSVKNPFLSKLPKAKAEAPVKQTPGAPSPKPAQAAVTKPSFRIAGLVWNSNKPQAIMDGQVVGVGQSINGWTIMNISKDGVEVMSQNTTFLIEP